MTFNLIKSAISSLIRSDNKPKNSKEVILSIPTRYSFEENEDIRLDYQVINKNEPKSPNSKRIFQVKRTQFRGS